MASPLPMNRPVPMAPPSPIITIWALLKLRCSPCSRSLIGFVCMAPATWPHRTDRSAPAPGAAAFHKRLSRAPGAGRAMVSELARDGKANRARLDGQQRIGVLRRVDRRDLRALVRQIARKRRDAPLVLDDPQAQVYERIGRQLDVLVYRDGQDLQQRGREIGILTAPEGEVHRSH